MSHQLSVNSSPQMLELLSDNSISKRIAAVYPDLQQILFQVMLDITTEENQLTVGPTILGIRNTMDILLLFRAKGDALIQLENQQENKNAATN